MKRILITGANSFLGGHLYRAFCKAYDVYGTYNTRAIELKNFISLNLEDADRIVKVLNEVKPSCVIHNAAVSNPDYAEVHREIAWKVNVESTRVIADWCHEKGAKLCFISTDQVFDGSSSYYKEDDETGPVNYYGVTKVEAEKITLGNKNNAVFRMALMYGKDSFFSRYKPEWLWNKLGGTERIRVFVDQYRSILCVNNAAELIKRAIDIDFSGIMHIGGPERVSRYEMARTVCEHRGVSADILEPVHHDEVSLVAPRPRDVSLNISKAISVLRVPVYTIKEALMKYL